MSYNSHSSYTVKRALSLLVVLALAIPHAMAAQFSTDAVKAAYLYRFASYVEWPAAAGSEAAFVIGVAGGEDVAVHLEHLTTGMSVRGKPVRVRRVTEAEDLKGVHILYVGANVFRSTRPLRMHAVEKPILLVTDSPEGLAGGGVINFVQVDRNLRFEISLRAADRSRLKIDSALLSVAARVHARKQ